DNWHDRVQIVNTATSASVLDTTVLHATSVLGVLTNGGSRLRQYVFRLPDGPVGAGPLRVAITADYYSAVVEYNGTGTAEANNVASADFSSSIAPYSDLAIDSFNVSPATFESGRQI